MWCFSLERHTDSIRPWYEEILYPKKQLCVTINKYAFVWLISSIHQRLGFPIAIQVLKFHLGLTSLFDQSTQHTTLHHC